MQSGRSVWTDAGWTVAQLPERGVRVTPRLSLHRGAGDPGCVTARLSHSPQCCS